MDLNKQCKSDNDVLHYYYGALTFFHNFGIFVSRYLTGKCRQNGNMGVRCNKGVAAGNQTVDLLLTAH